MKDGKCKCLHGKKLINGECQNDPQIKCKGGKVQSNQCFCPKGLKLMTKN